MTDAAFWSRIAPRYAASPVGNPANYEATMECCRDLIGPQDRVLELGCGTGSTALKLAAHAGHVTATDVAPGMIDIARAKLTGDAPANVDFRVAAAHDIQPDAPFDVVCAFNLLHLVPDLDAACAALYAQTRPGGRLITKTPCIGEMTPVIRLVIPVMRLFGKAPRVSWVKRGHLLDALSRAGFEIEQHRHFGKAKTTRFITARRPA